MLRVTSNTISNSFIGQLSTLESEQEQLQGEAASGLAFTQLSDNPTGMLQVLNLQSQSSQNSQYQQNITALQQTASSSYNAIQGLQTLAQRANEIATLADGTTTPAQLSTYAAEVEQLIQQGVQLANSQNQGQYLFGGTVSNRPPFVAATDASGTITAVTYQGNASVPAVEIGPGNTVSAEVPGVNTTGTGPSGLITDSRSGADFFNHLISLQNDLLSGNISALSGTDAPALAKDVDNLTLQAGTNGVLQSQLTDASTVASTQSTSLDTMMSQTDSADLAQTMTKLNEAQNAFQAALQTGAMLFNPQNSLLYYLA